MAVLDAPGDPTKVVPPKNWWEYLWRWLRSDKIHVECGGRWRTTEFVTYGHFSTCDRCGCRVYETDY
jgi:hypothetical protein